MPLRLVRSRRHEALWKACTEAFLGAVRGSPGPAGHPEFLLLTHRVQRDALLEAAADLGVPGWLDPPLAFFSDLRPMFGIEARPVGILTGRMLVARLAGQVALRTGVRTAGRDRGPAGTHMLDRVFSELLPEGVTPADLRSALEPLSVDEFTRRRNAWVADTYEAFLSELEERELYDPRSIHGMVASRIEQGGLQDGIGGARVLHVYGVTSLRARGRLFRALADQREVEVRVYLPLEDEPSEWEPLATGGIETVECDGLEATVTVQPAPDAVREATWVARRVKRILDEGLAEPHQIAVVARSGHEDTRLVHTALEEVGVPSTARLRTVLAEVPALKALLQLLRAEADGWTFERLRQVLTSPYFSPGVDLRPVDVLATTRRLEGREAWRTGLERIRDEIEGETGRKWRRMGISGPGLRRDLPRLFDLFSAVSDLGDPRSEQAWIDLTLDVLGGERFDLRRRLCEPVGDRWDIVRLDQRGVEHVERLLREWRGLVRSTEPMPVREWYERLRRLLEANELALSTPSKEGVHVLEAHEAALSPFPHTIVVHANDGVFPRTPVSMGVFSDEERVLLREAGLPMTDRLESMRRERTLWRAVTGGPRVTVTYRTTDANGVPRLPSLMVPPHDPASELPRTLDLDVGTEGATEANGLAPVSPAQLRRAETLKLKAVRRAGRREPFETASPRHLRRAVLGAFADELRSGGLDDFVRREADLGVARGPDAEATSDPEKVFGIDRPISLRPTAWNGRIRDPVVLAELARKFGDDYVWSSSQLETYGKRPFDFLLGRVLRLEEVTEADEETSALALGNVAHRILEGFYASLLGSIPESLDPAAERQLDEVADAIIREIEADQDEWLGLEPLWEVTRRDVREMVRSYLEWELPYMASKGERPVAVELQFGMGDHAPVEVRGRDAGGDPARILLRGRIDRVDRHGDEAGGVLRVLDYKTGFSSLPKQKGYEDGALLQTALYMRAVDSLGIGPVDRARYRGIRQPGKPANKYDLKYTRAEPTLRLALSIPGRVRAGLFEAVQAASAPIVFWQPARDVIRSEASLADGSRFDRLSE